jgi:hypothetical protein
MRAVQVSIKTVAAFDTYTSYVHVVDRHIVAGLEGSYKLMNTVANVKNAGRGGKTHETDLKRVSWCSRA